MYIVVAVVIVIIIAVWYYLRTPACSPACVLPQTCVTTSGVAACTSPAVPVVPACSPACVLPQTCVVASGVATCSPAVPVVPTCTTTNCLSPSKCVANVCTVPAVPPATYYTFESSAGPTRWNSLCDGVYALSMQNPMVKLPGSAVATDYVYYNPTIGYSVVGIDSTGVVLPNYTDLDNAAGYACNDIKGLWMNNVDVSNLTITTGSTPPVVVPPGTYVKGALSSTLPVSYTLGGSLPGNCSNTFMLNDSNMITTDGSQRYLYTYDFNQNLITDLSKIPTQAANFACYNNAGGPYISMEPLTSVETLTANYP